MSRFMMATLLLTFATLSPPTPAADRPPATLYKNPQCGCCDGHAEHLRDNGYEVTVIETDRLDEIKQRHGVPAELAGCHTILIDGYVVEGHVPAGQVDRLLDERPEVTGIALPGMPQGSPGMGGPKTAPFTIYEFAGGSSKVYAVE